MGDERQFERFGQVLQQVEAVRDLHRPRRAAAGALGVGAGAVAGDHVDAGVLAQPSRERARLAVGQQRHRTTPVEVHQHGAVGVPLAQRPVIDAQGGRGGELRHGRRPDQAQQRAAARCHPQRVAEASTGGPAQREAHGRETVGQPCRPACPWGGDAGQAFGEDAPRATRVAAKQATDTEPHGHRMAAPRHIGQGSLVTAVNPAGPVIARRAPRRSWSSTQRERDCGRGRLKVPGFEPDRGRVRQQAGEQLHRPDMAPPQT